MFDFTDPNAVAQGFGMGQMPVAKGPPSFWDRLWTRAQDTVAPRPEAVGSLLSEQDHKAARNQGLLSLGASLLADSGWSTNAPTFGQAMGRGILTGQQSYNGAVENSVKQALAKQGFDVNKLQMKGLKDELARAESLKTSRAAIMEKHGRPTPGDMAGTAQWIDNVLPDLIAAGDEETVARLSEIRKSLGGQTNQKAFTEVDRGDVIELRDPRTGKVLETIKKGAAPRDTGAGAEQRQALQMQRDFQREQQLGDDFNKDTIQYRQTAVKLDQALQEAPRAQAGDPAAAMNMLYAFVSAMDPASVVREGEIALAQAITPMWPKVQSMYQKYLNGDRSFAVPPEMVASMAELMRRRYSGLERATNERVKYYQGRGSRWGIDSSVFAGIDPLAGAPGGGFSDVTGGAGSTAPGAARPSLDDLSRGR